MTEENQEEYIKRLCKKSDEVLEKVAEAIISMDSFEDAGPLAFILIGAYQEAYLAEKISIQYRLPSSEVAEHMLKIVSTTIVLDFSATKSSSLPQ